jgi:hypothetical protein
MPAVAGTLHGFSVNLMPTVVRYGMVYEHSTTAPTAPLFPHEQEERRYGLIVLQMVALRGALIDLELGLILALLVTVAFTEGGAQSYTTSAAWPRNWFLETTQTLPLGQE